MAGFSKDPDPYGYKRSEEIRNERDKEFLEMFNEGNKEFLEMFNEGSSPTVPSSAFGEEFKTDVVSHDHKLSTGSCIIRDMNEQCHALDATISLGKFYYDEHVTPVFTVTRQEPEQSTVDGSYDRAMSVLDNED
jgi:hypothetical protein